MSKEALQGVGVKLVDLVMAVADGVGIEDIEEGTALLVALAGVAEEIAADPDSALLDIFAGASSSLADIRRS